MNIYVAQFVSLMNEFGVACPFQQVGSRFIGGATEDSDHDWLVNVPLWAKQDALDRAEVAGFNDHGSGEVGDTRFESLIHHKDPSINMILVFDDDYFVNWMRAARVCKYINDRTYGVVLDKDARVHIHRIVMDGWIA